MGFLCRDNGSKGGQREMNTREAMMRSAKVRVDCTTEDLRNEVGLEFVEIDVERTIET